MNIPLLFIASVISDVDLVLPGLVHRGPTHSLIITSMLFLPIFLIYRKKAVPYYIAFTQHLLIGDVLMGGKGIQLLWPITTSWYGLGISIAALTNVLLEWIFFIGCMAIMLKTKDLHMLFQSDSANLTLAIPTVTVLLPTLFSFPLEIPPELIIPHLTFLAIFTISIVTDLRKILKKT